MKSNIQKVKAIESQNKRKIFLSTRTWMKAVGSIFLRGRMRTESSTHISDRQSIY